MDHCLVKVHHQHQLLVLAQPLLDIKADVVSSFAADLEVDVCVRNGEGGTVNRGLLGLVDLLSAQGAQSTVHDVVVARPHDLADGLVGRSDLGALSDLPAAQLALKG